MNPIPDKDADLDLHDYQMSAASRYTIDTLPTLEMVTKPNKGRHYITPSGKLVPSVTNSQGIIEKPALMWWAANVERIMVKEYAVKAYNHERMSGFATTEDFEAFLTATIPKQQARFRISREATDIGKETHALVQHRCKEMLSEGGIPRPKATEHAELAFMAWEEWTQKVNFEPLATEITVWSDRMHAAGTLDSYSIHDWPEPGERRHFVDDWKSSKVSKTAPNGIYPESLVQVSTYAQMLVDLGIAPENTMGCIVRLPKSLEDPIFDKGYQGEVDHAEVWATTRKEFADGFEAVRKAWSFMKSLS